MHVSIFKYSLQFMGYHKDVYKDLYSSVRGNSLLEESGKMSSRIIYFLRSTSPEGLECKVILLTLLSDRKGILVHCVNEKIVFIYRLTRNTQFWASCGCMQLQICFFFCQWQVVTTAV